VASTTQSSNAVQAEAARTIAYEIVETLGRAPDWMLIPTGGGGTIAAIGRGFLDLLDAGLTSSLPRLAAIVPKDFDALGAALDAGIDSQKIFDALPYSDDRPTVLTKLAHAHPPDGLDALHTLRRFDGVVIPVDDEAAIDAVATIGATDGLYLEPSSAVALPALENLTGRGLIRPGQQVVALACGSAFRETFLLHERRPPSIKNGRIADLAKILGLF
jgi:threonine synthase